MKEFRAIVVGPGNIFNKAYLPFIFDLEELKIVGIVGKSEEKLKKYKEMYNIDTYTDIDKAIVLKPDCAFVHTSTNSHYEIVKKLLFNNINVYVDKPLTDDLEKTKELVSLAMDRSLILTIGFNRRFAPMYQMASNSFGRLRPDLYIMEKNRSDGIRDDAKFTLYDDFIHVVDTLCYLMGNIDSTNIINVSISKENNSLKNITVTISSDNAIAIGLMHRNSGKDYERLEIHGNGRSIVVDDMDNIKIMDNNGVYIRSFKSWDSISYRRGFVGTVKNFLKSLDEKKSNNDELICSLKTHQLVDDILRRIDS